MLFVPSRQFGEIYGKLSIVSRINSSKSLRSHQAISLTHDVEIARCVGTWRKVEATRVGMQHQELLCGLSGNEIRPCLIDLFNDIQWPILNGMESHHFELH